MAEVPKSVATTKTLESESIEVRDESRALFGELSAEVMASEMAEVFPDFNAQELQEPDIQVAMQTTLKSKELDARTRNESESATSVFARLVQLKAEKLPLRDSLTALRLEFKNSIDKETDAVLAQFEALFSPNLIPDEKEREAVETLFFSQNVTSFTPAVFTGFLDTIYEQPDNVISAETKARIKERFKPKQKITTGGELKSAAFGKNESGEYEYNSPESALQLENGMKAYAQPNGKMAVSVDGSDWGSGDWIEVNIHNWTGERMAKRSNYWLLHTLVHDQLDGMNGLFGGKMSGDGWSEENRDEAVENSARFLRCLVGRREPNHLIQLNDLEMLWSSMDALVNPKNLSRTENLNDLRELGVLNGNQFNWNRLETVGKILRENRNFRAQAMKNPALPHQLLKGELAKRDPLIYKERRQSAGLTSANGQSGGCWKEKISFVLLFK